MTQLSRRRFLQIAGASAGAVAAAATGAGLSTAGARATSARAKGLRTVPTYCDICFWKCNAIATVENGVLWKIEGNPEDPLSRGRLCPRGTGGVGAHQDPDRLRTPLMRTKLRGEDQWTAVTWDEALGYIADKMQKIKAKYGPEAVAGFSHGIGGTFLKHTLKAYGAVNLAAPSFAQCRGPRDVGFELTFGEGVGSPERTDIANARCLVLIGSHLGENMHNTQVQEFAEAVGNGASIIVVDPRFSIAASKAKYYLPARPGTDLALLLAWMNVIVTEGLYDRDYVAQHGFGFDAFVAELAQWTPERAFPETGIEPEVIRATAREMALHRPATLVHPGRHASWYGDDAQRSRAIALLNALLGSWGRKGGFYQPASMEVPGYPYPPYPKSAKGKVDNPAKKYPFASEALTTGIRDATISGKPYPIKGWFVYATNLLQALPDQAATLAAIQNLDLLVVVDVVGSETAGWADVVLPESTYLERYDDLNVELFREPFVALRQPVVDSPHDQKPNWWIARELAIKLGLKDYYPWKTIEDYLDHRLRGAGLSLEQLQRQGLVRGAKQPLYYEDGVVPQFATPSQKIEFYSVQLKDAGFDPVPRYTRPDPGPPGSFRLLFGRSPVHSFSRTQTNPVLAQAMGENELWLNAAVAERMGLAGRRVWLRNQDGVRSDFSIKVRATEAIRPDCVYMVHGFGHTSKLLPTARGRGANDAQLVTRYVTDPLMGGTGMNVNFVTLEQEG
ncbi:MAG TPA: molybdopterin-dependent oxidoreductase [Kofleriaceae bacterium]|mgnify:CR=1 FL=1|nr:molybdopterin-dependent oxidoreductase [Kofleriaceae bacterium]